MKSGYKFEAKRSPNGQARKYQTQYDNAKQCAKQRNIEWQFTYDTWIEWWGDDIVNRGCKSGQLVMARNGDIGPYHPTNVSKKTCNENISEGNKGRIHSKDHTTKIVVARTGSATKLKGSTWSIARREAQIKKEIEICS
jgi:hypothetical protein